MANDDVAERGGSVTLVVTLTIRRGALETFRAFENEAARIMSRHGGVIERTIFVPPASGDEPMREVHVVTFPSSDSFAAYRADPALVPLQAIRAAAISGTEVLVGRDGPVYGVEGVEQ